MDACNELDQVCQKLKNFTTPFIRHASCFNLKGYLLKLKKFFTSMSKLHNVTREWLKNLPKLWAFIEFYLWIFLAILYSICHSLKHFSFSSTNKLKYVQIFIRQFVIQKSFFKIKSLVFWEILQKNVDRISWLKIK